MSPGLCKKLSVACICKFFHGQGPILSADSQRGPWTVSATPPRHCCQVKLLTLEALYTLPGGLFSTPPPNLGQWEKVVCFALQIGVSYSLFPSSSEYAQICQNPVEDCGSERRPCYVSLIKLRKGKCTFYCQSSCICSRGCITILKQPWGGKSSFSERVTTYSGEIGVVMESVDLINFTAYLYRLGTGKITK